MSNISSFLGSSPKEYLTQQSNPRPALFEADGRNADEGAEVIRLSRETELPPEMVESSLPDIKRQRTYDALDNTPKLSEFLSEGYNARLAHDDIDALSKIEGYFSGNTRGTKVAKGAARAALETSDVPREVGAGALTGLGSALSGLGAGYDSLVRLTARGLDAALPESADKYIWLQEGQKSFDPTDFLTTNPGQALKDVGRGISVPQSRRGFGDDVASGLGNMGAQIGIAALTGGAGGVAALTAQGVDQQVERQLQSGALGQSAGGDLALFGAGAATAALEKIGLGKVTQAIPDAVKSSLGKKVADIATTAGVEGVTELLEGVTQGAIEYATTNSEAGIFDGAADDLKLGASVGGIARALVLTAIPGQQRLSKAQREQIELDEVLGSIDESKLSSRDPETMQAYIEKLSQGGEVYLPAKDAIELYQSDVEGFADEWGLSAEDIQESLVTGEDIAVPVSTFLARSGSPNFEGLRDIVRTSHDGLNRVEIANNEAREALQQEYEDSLNQEVQSEIVEGFGRSIETNIVTQLTDAGAAPEIATTQAQIWRSFFETLETKGVDAREAFDQLGLRIQGEGQAPKTTPLDLIIDDIKAGNFPTEQDAFGLSLLEFAREVGVKDDQGDLADRDINLIRKPGQRNVLRDDGIELDDLAISAWETGYFDQIPDRNELIDALSEETGGNPRYVASEVNDDAVERLKAFESVDEAIRGANVDINLPTQDVREKLLALQQGQSDPDGVTYNQDGEIDRDANFKAWFGDSKVVDENGEPLVVYHGTPNKFESFSKDAKGTVSFGFGSAAVKRSGFFFSKDKEFSKGFADPYKKTGEVLSVYLKADRVFDVDDDTQFEDIKTYAIKNGASREGVEWLDGKRYDEDFWEVFDDDNGAEVSSWIKGAGFEGVKFKEPDADTGEISETFVVFEPNQIKSVHNQGAFDPNDPRILFQESRASVTLSESGALTDDAVLVRLSKAADASSFLHESGHIFLELYRALAPNNEAIASEFERVKEWLGADGDVFTTEQHEQFAEGFETYLFEGNAPSVELQGVFTKFRAWFTRIYRSLKDMNTQLNPLARDIFDRMLATEDAIETARRANDLRVSEAFAGIMKPETAEIYRNEVELARQSAEQKLLTKALREIKSRERKEYKKALAQAKDEATLEVKARPVYEAFTALTEGNVKLLKSGVVELRGKAILNRLLRSKERVYSDKGSDPDVVAENFGFANGDELIMALANAPKIKDAIADETARLMKERVGDFMTDGTMEREAAQIVYGEHSKVLMVEQNVLAEKALAQAMPMAEIKAVARNLIELSPIKRVVRPGQYALNANNAAKRAVRLTVKGDYVGALHAKQQQLLNHELSRLSYKAREEVGRIERYLKRFAPNRKLDAKKINPEHIGKIRQLIGLSGEADQTVSRDALLGFADQQAEQGYPIILPVNVQLGDNLKRREDMTLFDLRDFRDGVKSIYTQGRRQSESSKEEFREYVSGISDQVNEAWGDRPRKDFERGDTARLPEILRQGDAEILRYPFLIETLQGDKQGLLIDDMETRLRGQLVARNQRRNKLEQAFADILKKHGITQKELNKKYSLPEISGVSVKFEKVISVALNMGTAQNIDRVYSDPSTADAEAIQSMLNTHLEKRHWDAVQETWDLIGTLWPEAQEVEKRVSGVEPKGVEAQPLQTPYGEYRGGYYPIKYDLRAPANDKLKSKTDEDKWKALTSAVATRASTNQGYLVERQNNISRPLNLDLAVVLEHFDDVTNDIYMREAATDIDRIIRHPTFRNAVSETHGKEYLRTLETILKRTVAGTERVQGPFDSILRTTRVNAALAILGWKVTTAALAPVSYAQTVVPRYGWDVVKSGLAQFYGRGPLGMIENSKFINEKSFFMAERAQLITREAHEMVRKSGGETAWDRFRASGFLLMQGVEKYTVSGPLWMGVYKDALDKGKSEEDAITLADKSIATTQGSGLEIDQSIMQGDVETKRLFTFMWGYMSGYYGTVRNDVASRDGMQKAWPVVKQFVLLNLAAASIEAAIREGLDNDEDPYWQEVLKYMHRNVLGLIPGISTVFSRYDSGPSVAGLGKQAIGTVDAFADAGEELMDAGYISGETSSKVAVRTTETLGFAFGVPGTLQAKQIWKTYTKDDDPTLYEAIISGPDKDN